MTRSERRASFRQLAERVSSGPGVLPPEARAGLAAGEALAPRVEKIMWAAASIEDAEVEAALQHCSDDALFEVTVITALRASTLRLTGALSALGRE